MTDNVAGFVWRPRGVARPSAVRLLEPSSGGVPAVPAVVLPDKLAQRFAKDKKPAFVPSPQQAGYFEWITSGKGSCILEAVAGAGKTTTLIKGLLRMEGSVFFGAYGKDIAKEIKRKVEEDRASRPGLYISTMHGVGYSACISAWPKTQLDDRKTAKMLSAMVTEDPIRWKHAADFPVFIQRMVSFGKQFLLGCRDKPSADNLVVWLKLVQHFSVDQDLPENVEPEEVLPVVIEVYNRCRLECPERIDYDDMLFGPIAYELRFYKNDWVLVDEAQDINPARRELARRLLKKNGRAVFVGDSRQAIYGFTGAGGDSLERIAEEFNCVRLPLTVTYRCPKAVVNYAHRWVQHIEAHPSAPEGIVRPVRYKTDEPCPACAGIAAEPIKLAFGHKCKECGGSGRKSLGPWFLQDKPGPTDAIICRYTRPLILTAYGLIKEGIACKVEGRDIGNGLIALAQLWKIRRISVLEERLVVYLEREIQKARAAGSEKREEEITDKVGTLQVFIDRCKARGISDIDGLIREIRSLFDDDVKECLVLCSGHKAKGREWDTVRWILHSPRMRSGRQPWEAVQEENIHYVICTRAKKELVLIPEAL